jgi:hypothetical protein
MKMLSVFRGRAGSHTWNIVQPFNGITTPLSRLVGNATRLWTVETRGMVLQGSAWGSNSRGTVRVGAVPWNDDGSLNPAYYHRLRKVVAQAARRDILTGVVLFDNAFTSYFPQGWANHPFNGLGPSRPSQVHTRGPWNRFQRAHVNRVVDTLTGFDNVVYEVGNELPAGSTRWFQGAVVRWVKERTNRPVGVSYAVGTWRNQSWLTKQGADFIVPNNSPRAGGVRRIPGFRGPQLLDTDHGWALQSNVNGLRQAWNQGRAVWLMDGLNGDILRNNGSLQPDRDFITSVTQQPL